MMPQRKIALVTGGATRVGAAISETLAEAGYHVVIHYRSSEAPALALDKKLKAKGLSCDTLQANLMQRDAARALAESAIARFGGIDLLVSSAANFLRANVQDTTDAIWDDSLALNVSGPFALIQAAAQSLKERAGAIVMITGASTATPYRDYLAYIVSKGASQHLMRTLALELAPQVRVNAVAPGTVLPPEDYSSEDNAKLASSVPLKRNGSAQDIADAVLYLSRAGFVTGQELRVDGGYSLRVGP